MAATGTKLWNILSGALAALGAAVGLVLGPVSGLLIALLSMEVLDYITGVIAAAVNRQLSSAVGFKGIARKVLILVIVAVAHLLDVYVLGGGHAVLRTAVIGFYIANEGLSILENAGECGLPIPQRIAKALKQLRHNDEIEEGGDNAGE